MFAINSWSNFWDIWLEELQAIRLAPALRVELAKRGRKFGIWIFGVEAQG